MDDNRVYHIHPHILRRGVDSEREMIFHAPMDTEGWRSNAPPIQDLADRGP
jgi:hypothetical protein